MPPARSLPGRWAMLPAVSRCWSSWADCRAAGRTLRSAGTSVAVTPGQPLPQRGLGWCGRSSGSVVARGWLR